MLVKPQSPESNHQNQQLLNPQSLFDTPQRLGSEIESHPIAKKLDIDAIGGLKRDTSGRRHRCEIVDESNRAYEQEVNNLNSENRYRTKSAESAAARFKP